MKWGECQIIICLILLGGSDLIYGQENKLQYLYDSKQYIGMPITQGPYIRHPT
jgi:hypothetical protein